MFRNTLRLAVRRLRRNRVYSLINVGGLMIGLCCCFLIFLFVSDELSYDRFHQNADRIFRVKLKLVLNDVVYDEASLQFPAAEALKSEIPEIVEAVRIYRNGNPPVVSYQDQAFTEERFLFADSTFFRVFDFVLLQGDPSSALSHANGLVVTEETAQKYFGEEEPIGKVLTVQNGHDFLVTGVAANPPDNVHFGFDFVAPMQAQFNIWEQQSEQPGPQTSWFWNGSWTYLLLSDSDAAEPVSSKFSSFVSRHFPPRFQSAELGLQPLTDIYLHSRLGNEIEPTSQVLYVYVFSGIALFVLLIACINFANLATAQSMQRAREMGVRKSLGAENQILRAQLLGETFLMSLVAVCSAIVVTGFTIPAFNQISGKHIILGDLFTAPILISLPMVAVLVGICAGIYPAMVIPHVQPAIVLKGIGLSGRSKGTCRRGLVIFQFALSLSLMIGIAVIFRQMDFLQSQSLGFNHRSVVMVTARPGVNGQFDAFRRELLRNPSITDVAGTSDAPGRGANGFRFVPEEGQPDQPVMLPLSFVDAHYLSVMQIDVVEGRGFSEDFPADTGEAFVINRKAAETLGWTNSAVGRKLDFVAAGGEEIAKSGRVIGVVNNFHFESLHHEIKPMVLTLSNQHRYYALRVGTDIPGAIAHLESTWKRFGTDWPLDYSFLDQDLDQLYRQEARLGDVVGYCALLAVFIGCLGLYGLSSFSVAQRTKEIGIRKVMGATLFKNIELLAREYVVLVGTGTVIAVPIAYVVMQEWLSNFAFHASLDPWIFVLAGPVGLVIALTTVSKQCLRVARLNPVETIRHA